MDSDLFTVYSFGMTGQFCELGGEEAAILPVSFKFMYLLKNRRFFPSFAPNKSVIPN
jgi:hypothetical protein